MLQLEDPRWSELRHAYGAAADIPPLLAQLRALPSDEANSEPWFSLWSSLAHQGDVYSASFAAVPHVVAALASGPTKAPAAFFHFPAWVEVCRARSGAEVPALLASAYEESLGRLPALVAAAAQSKEWSHELCQCALAAVAVAKGQHGLAEALVELSPEVTSELLAWLEER